MDNKSPPSLLERIAELRRPKEPDRSLRFLKTYFRQQVAKQHNQVAALVELWEALVPPELLEHTRLESLTRGVLRVGVDSSSHLYKLDRLLRSGLEKRLRMEARIATLRRVQLRLVVRDEGEPRPQTGSTDTATDLA